MTKALIVGMFVGAVLVASGCNKSSGGTSVASGPSPFDKRWDELQKQGSQAIQISGEGGAALMDNVMGAQGGALAAAPWLAESMKGGARQGPLPERPDANEVSKLVRQYVPGVKTCYAKMQKEGDTRTGKAIVSFKIAGNGKVENLSVEAPAFEGSQLPSCVNTMVSHWVFPPSKSGAPASSYPFVFVGG